MIIVAPSRFRHAGDLRANWDTFDPRQERFDATEVVVDLRECEFVNPAAALWCATYLSLARLRGSACTMLVPMNMGVCVYLKSIGLFDLLVDRGVEVDTQGIPDRGPGKTVLPVTCFHTTTDADNLVNDTFERLQAGDYASGSLTPVVTELFAELVLNAAQHSHSPVGSFACVQFYEYESGSRFTCTVADGGIGILKSLHQNPSLQTRVFYDWDALELAIRERISGTCDPHRGIGLYGVSEDVRKPERALLIHSGLGSLEIKEDMETSARRTRLFPGTLVTLTIPS
jgi:hypothetical protein